MGWITSCRNASSLPSRWKGGSKNPSLLSDIMSYKSLAIYHEFKVKKIGQEVSVCLEHAQNVSSGSVYERIVKL